MSSEKKELHGKETILLIDDEECIIDYITILLNGYGYTVLQAKNSVEALKIYETNKDKIDLVMLDISLPDFSGLDTMKNLLKINPKAKVLLCSGNVPECYNQSDKIVFSKAGAFLHKPFENIELLETLKKMTN